MRSFAAAVLVLVPALALAQSDAAPPAYVAIPNLDRAILHAEAMSGALQPGKLQPGSLKPMLGLALGDPGLANLGRGPLVAFMFIDAGRLARPAGVLALPVKDPQPFVRALEAKGAKTRVTAGVLWAAGTDEDLARAAPLRASYDRIAATTASATGDVRMSLPMRRIDEAYGAILAQALEAAAAQASAPKAPGERPSPFPMAALLAVEARMLRALCADMDEVQLDFLLEPRAISSESLVTPRAGSALADFFTMPAPGPSRASGVLSGPALMSADYQLDPQRMGAFLAHLAKPVASDPALAGFGDFMEKWAQLAVAYTGDFSYRMRAGDGAIPRVEAVIGVRDEKLALASLDLVASMLAPGKPMGDFYAAMGVTFAFQKDIRRHGSASVHAFRFGLDPKKVPPDLQSMKGIVRDMEVAVTHGFYLMAQDPGALDALIDRVEAGVAPVAPRPEHMRVSYDFVALMQNMAKMMPSGKADPFGSLSADSEPVTGTVTFAQGLLRGRTRVPLDPFIALAKAAADAKAAASPEPSRTDE